MRADIDVGYDSKRFISDKEASQLVSLMNAAFGFKHITSLIGRQRSKDSIRFRPVEVSCREARERMGLTIKQAARQMKVQQYRLHGAEGDISGEINLEVLERYIDFLGLREWFDMWVASNPDVYKRIEKWPSKNGKRMK